ncbi:MAG: carboxypeptidase-like regulatory domain-containing protein [Candidatus Baltobacteraceae bacterium]
MFSGTGGADVGTHRTQSSLGGAQNQNEVGLSMQLLVSRRTERSSILLNQVLGANNGLYDAGQINLAYTTPQYIFAYGPVNGPSDTQLSSGSFNRGFTLGIPHGADELDFIAARTTGLNNEGFRVGGIRHTKAFSKGLLLSESAYLAKGDQSGGSDSVLDLALGRYRAGQTLRGEAALTHTQGLFGVPNGTRLAYAVHADLSGARASTSFAYTTIPVGYVALGQIQYAQNSVTLTSRRNLGDRGALTFDYGDLRSDINDQISRTTHDTVNLNLRLSRSVNLQSLINFARNSSADSTTLERDGGLSLSEQLRGFNLTQTAQASTITANNGSGASTQSQFAFGVTHPLLRGFLSLQSNVGRLSGGGGLTIQNENFASFSKPLGRKTDLGVSFDVEKTQTSGGSATSSYVAQTFVADVLRRISSVVSVRVTYGRTHQTGIGGGSAHYVNVDFVGPLAFGAAARYSGRANPNLPSVIQGHVYLQDAPSSYGLVGNRGIPNALITLDGGTTQRTDGTGAFEFRFVHPGNHTLTLATGTLPAGVIADAGSQNFIVQGGQVAIVDFGAGSFAGVGGRVLVQTGGSAIGLAGAGLVVDGNQRAYTAADGSYQIGHLSPGKHTIELIPDSLPASVSNQGQTQKSIDVSQGVITPLDWLLAGLGSIKGVVLYTADSGFGDLKGARNVYVVAEPGEHAAISDDDGSFIIDNLPPGQYTLSLDSDTLPDGQAVIQGPEGPVSVTGDEAVEGMVFKIGAAAKQVILTYSGGSKAAVTASFSPEKAPPGALVDLIASTDQRHPKSVLAQSDVFGNFPLHHDAKRNLWIARVAVPSLQNGDYAVHIDVRGERSGGADASLSVDNRIPLVYARAFPRDAKPGQIVRVTARVLGAVSAGDTIYFEDGNRVKLPAPIGHIFGFTLRIGSGGLPYRGFILNRRGERIPIVVAP